MSITYIQKKYSNTYQGGSKKNNQNESRFRFLFLFLIGVFLLVFAKMFFIMILQHNMYLALASGSREMYKNLFPERGKIFVQDSRSGEEYPIALNKDYFLLYADTREIKDDDTAEKVSEKLSEIFSYTDEEKLDLFIKLNKRDDPYEPIENKINDELYEKIKNEELTGIYFKREQMRFYPEFSLASSVSGFLGIDSDGSRVGRYGIEGYWDDVLAGKGGFYSGSRSGGGGVITSRGWSFEPAEDGADILLTIDRTLQYKACQILEKKRQEYKAVSASLVIIEPKTGKIRAMCDSPNFDPNEYNMVDSIQIYNNNSIFTPYEPGSIFKPVAVAAALNENLITPDSYFYDVGQVEGLCSKPIKNAGGEIYKDQTITGILDNSINTGMVYIVGLLGKEKFRDYVEDFGFGIKTGIKIDSEVSGTIDSLRENKGDDVDCYTATASFGQGLTATPIQLLNLYATIANNGKMMKPYIIEKVRYQDGSIDRFYPHELKQIISPKSATLLSGMLVSVIDKGHASGAGVKGYYLAGKTGTAQISGIGGYIDDTNHSFVGFGPIDDPKFAMIVKFEKPELKYSASTAAPTFGDIAKFLLNYYHIPPNRS